VDHQTLAAKEHLQMFPHPRHLTRLAFVGLVVLLSSSSSRGEEVEWRPDYESARREAADKNRPLLLDFGTENCFWCKKLDAVTFRDDRVVKKLNAQFVSIKIDAGRYRELVKYLQIEAFPTMVFASPDGKLIGKPIVGFQEPEPFHDQLDKVLKAVPPSVQVVADPDWMEKEYTEAGKAIASSEYGRAIALLKNVCKDGKDRTVQVKAGQLLQDLEQQAAGRLARAKQLADKGQTTEAVETVTELLRQFGGTDAAAEGSQMLTTLAARPEIKTAPRSARARDLLAEAREDFRTQQYLLCLHRCEILTTTYGETPEGIEAKQLAADIRSNPDRLRAACETLSEQLGTMYLSQAEAWLRKGSPKEAMLCLERVIQALPGSRQAEVAQMRLAQIQGQPPTRTVDFKKP
jgi:thioredoxin-related protein